jgi:hypothetical protein
VCRDHKNASLKPTFDTLLAINVSIHVLSDAFRYISVYHYRGLVETNVKRSGLLNRYWLLLHPNALEEFLLVNCRFFGTVPLSLLHWYLTKCNQWWRLLVVFFSVANTVQCDKLLRSVLTPRTHFNLQHAPRALTRNIFYLVFLTLKTTWNVQPF